MAGTLRRRRTTTGGQGSVPRLSPPGARVGWRSSPGRERALITLVDRHPDESVVAVCHAGIVEASFYLAFGLGWHGQPRLLRLPQHRHHPVEAQRGPHGRRHWTIVMFNDAAHLAGVATPAESPRAAVPAPPSDT